MKTIQNVQIWQNGSVKNASIFYLIIVNDNLSDTAVFYYSLKDNMLIDLSVGNLTMNGQEYQDWDSEPSANEFAYNWAASQLGLVITGEYVKPEATI